MAVVKGLGLTALDFEEDKPTLTLALVWLLCDCLCKVISCEIYNPAAMKEVEDYLAGRRPITSRNAYTWNIDAMILFNRCIFLAVFSLVLPHHSRRLRPP